MIGKHSALFACWLALLLCSARAWGADGGAPFPDAGQAESKTEPAKPDVTVPPPIPPRPIPVDKIDMVNEIVKLWIKETKRKWDKANAKPDQGAAKAEQDRLVHALLYEEQIKEMRAANLNPAQSPEDLRARWAELTDKISEEQKEREAASSSEMLDVVERETKAAALTANKLAEAAANQRVEAMRSATLSSEKERAKIAAPPPTTLPSGRVTSEKQASEIEFARGETLRYGLSLSLLRFTTSRRPDEPARLRNYTPALELLPAEFGFQFSYRPAASPWRLKKKGDDRFQLLSAGGILLARVDNINFARGGIAIAAVLGLFEETIGVGVGVDLYRGIAVQGADGTAGGGTAYTGILGWAFARQGEVTAENVFVVITLNLSQLAGNLQGQVK
ncbi:MAG TPA: hypothetical protein VK550_22605 [Polyangiaceae bacterium]|nr:hypothetical protein [Polyangiaceae bacterium]